MALTPNDVRRRASALLEQVRAQYPHRLSDPPWIGPGRLPDGTIEECMNMSALVRWCEAILAQDDDTLWLDIDGGNA